MGKFIQGYVRDIETGVGQVGVGVEVRYEGGPSDDGIVQADGYFMSANPATTDSTGFFSWERDMSPGPVKVIANVANVETKVRSGKETMQIGDLYVHDIGEFMQVFTDGVVSGRLEGCAVERVPGSLQYIVNPGRALVAGRLFTLDHDITKAVAANSGGGSFAVRHDLVVLRQIISGSQSGRQTVETIQGVANATDNTAGVLNNSTTKDLTLARLRINQGSGDVTAVDDLRTFANVFVGNNAIQAAQIGAGGNLSTATDAKVLKAPTTGLTPAWGTLTVAELAGVTGVGSSAGELAHGDHAHTGLTTTDHFVSVFDSVTDDLTASYKTVQEQAVELVLPATYTLYCVAHYIYDNAPSGTDIAGTHRFRYVGTSATLTGTEISILQSGNAVRDGFLVTTFANVAEEGTLIFEAKKDSGAGDIRIRRSYIQVYARRT